MTNALKNLSLKHNFIYLNYGFVEYKTYFMSFALILGSVLLPYIFHYFNMAGQIFLPIYFFVLIGAYKFGWKVGIMTGVFSPIISFVLTGMPLPIILPFVIIKGILLALTASFSAKKSKKISIAILLLVVFCYQFMGFLVIYLLTHNLVLSRADLVLGYPGLILQIIGGYLLLKFIGSYEGKKLETNSK
jgi:hypothetical protein